MKLDKSLGVVNRLERESMELVDRVKIIERELKGVRIQISAFSSRTKKLDCILGMSMSPYEEKGVEAC